MTLKELRARQEEIVAQARSYLDQIDKDTPEARAKELEASYDKAMAEYDRLDKRAERLERIEKAETALDEEVTPVPAGDDRAAKPPEPEQTDESREERRREAFRAWIRSGMAELDRETRAVLNEMQTRAQATSPGSAGGFTVPEGFVDEVMKRLKAWGPMLDPGVTRQITTSMGNDLPWPTVDDTSNKGAILGENSEDSEQDVVFGQKLLEAFKYTTRIIRISEEYLQDNAVDGESLIVDLMAERIARIVNEHLTTGTGSGQPNGIVTASTEGVEVALTNGNALLSFDSLIDLQHSVDPSYRALGGRWMFHDDTLKVLRKVKDDDNNYIWQPANVQTAAPATLLDNPYSINQDMPTLAAGAKSVVYGYFPRYVVRRVRELIMKRLVERYAEFHQVGLLGFGRFDGELIDTNAVKHLVHAGS